MPITSGLRRFGAKRFDRVIDRVTALRLSMPDDGVSVAAFEAMALNDLPPGIVPDVLNALHNRGLIFVRRARGEARVFGHRPASIAGIFRGREAIDVLLAEAAPHVRRIVSAVATRDACKADANHVGANAARDTLDAIAGRMVDLVRKHVARGLNLTEIRQELWALFSGPAMYAISTFEPALAESAVGALAPIPERKRRIFAGLSPQEKVRALIEKAGDAGLTKTALYQAIRPKLPSEELSKLLKGLCIDGRIEAVSARVKGSKRTAKRYIMKPSDVVAA